MQLVSLNFDTNLNFFFNKVNVDSCESMSLSSSSWNLLFRTEVSPLEINTDARLLLRCTGGPDVEVS